MPIRTTISMSAARATLASLLHRVAAKRQIVVIKRSGREDVALVSAAELSSLLEAVHLLRSPENARRLFTAIRRATSRRSKPQSLEQLRRQIGLGKQE